MQINEESKFHVAAYSRIFDVTSLILFKIWKKIKYNMIYYIIYFKYMFQFFTF
jgi:hypothetical protein